MTNDGHAAHDGPKLETVPIRRIFDDGEPLLFSVEPGDGFPWTAITVITSICDGPDCPCRDIELEARPLIREGESLVEHPEVEVQARLDIDSGAITPIVDPQPATPQAALLQHLRARLSGDRIELLRSRWHRVKRLDDLDEWKTVDWSGVDLTANVPYCEVFPSPWDLSVVLDDQVWWILDLWCLKPGCTCEVVGLSFHSGDGSAQAFIELDVSKRALTAPAKDETARRLWEALREEEGLLAELEERRSEMRKVARKLPSFLEPHRPASPPAPVGRNEPCPCGSGKKYKRCCGGVAARR